LSFKVLLSMSWCRLGLVGSQSSPQPPNTFPKVAENLNMVVVGGEITNNYGAIVDVCLLVSKSKILTLRHLLR
jgi:hypothetical protein